MKCRHLRDEFLESAKGQQEAETKLLTAAETETGRSRNGSVPHSSTLAIGHLPNRGQNSMRERPNRNGAWLLSRFAPPAIRFDEALPECLVLALLGRFDADFLARCKLLGKVSVNGIVMFGSSPNL